MGPNFVYHSTPNSAAILCRQISTDLRSRQHDTAIAIATHKMTALRSTTVRNDRYGNQVIDEAVFELTQRRPKAELYSVIPKGDKNKPPSP